MKNIYYGKDELACPFFSTLNFYSLEKQKNFGMFETASLFWSLTRLFTLYYRIMDQEKRGNKYIREYLENDTEAFIIRVRIILDDIAFIIRQILPSDTRGLGLGKGNVHPNNKHVSIYDLDKFLKKNLDKFPELKVVFDRNDWIFHSREQRDAIVHFKSKVILFDADNLSFGRIDANLNNPKRSEKLIDLYKFTNDQLTNLWRFINEDLNQWASTELNFYNKRTPGRIKCLGVEAFKKRNQNL